MFDVFVVIDCFRVLSVLCFCVFFSISSIIYAVILSKRVCMCVKKLTRKRSLSARDVLLVVVLVVSTKAFLFHNRSSLSFAYTLLKTLSTIAPCRIFKLSLN